MMEIKTMKRLSGGGASENNALKGFWQKMLHSDQNIGIITNKYTNYEDLEVKMQKNNETTGFFAPLAQNDVPASVGQPGKASMPPQNDAESLRHPVHPFRHPEFISGSQSTNFKAPLTRISSIRKAQAEIQPSPARGEGKQAAFTLAEVLITLGIIGIVAAMTLPALLQKQNEKAVVAKLKKNYSVFSNAMSRAVEENTTVDNWDLGEIVGDNTDSSIKGFEYIRPYLKLMKYCENKTGCLKDVNYKNLDGTPATNFNRSADLVKGQLADGTLFLWDMKPECNEDIADTPDLKNACGRLTFDINGYTKPNQYGKDFFVFSITKNGIVPWGMEGMYHVYADFNNCKTDDIGIGCAAWVIYNENMDYLHCSGLSWNGKKKCK